MRNMLDQNQPVEDANCDTAPDALTPNGEQAVMSTANPHGQSGPSLGSTGRCPFHAMLEGMGFWQEPDR